MKSWYKKSKMVDVDESTGTKYVFCNLCKKWAIDNDNTIEWKAYFEMSPFEQHQLNVAQKSALKGNVSYKSTVCPNCKGVNELV